jgi:ribosomal protein L12E/L44/L45/RPP1/RPP2
MKKRLSKEEGLRIKELIESMTKPPNPTCPHNPHKEEVESIIKKILEILGIEAKFEPKAVDYKVYEFRDKKLEDLLKGGVTK